VVKTDDTGLHALDCECIRCDAGYRPTELERAAARRALTLRLADEEKRKREAAGLIRPEARRAEVPRVIVPPTAEEFEELRKLREGLKR